MSNDLPLYPTEQQIARKVLGAGRFDEWKGLAAVWERQGLPPIDPETGGRFWPAVELWFQVKHRLATVALGRFGKPNGVETCPPPRKPRASSSAPGATVHRLHTGAPPQNS